MWEEDGKLAPWIIGSSKRRNIGHWDDHGSVKALKEGGLHPWEMVISSGMVLELGLVLRFSAFRGRNGLGVTPVDHHFAFMRGIIWVAAKGLDWMQDGCLEQLDGSVSCTLLTKFYPDEVGEYISIK